jgi:3-mercaptopyruvate sulfurtransferase SseA
VAIIKKALLPILAVALTLGLVWYLNRPQPPAREASWEDVQAEASQGGYRLITTAELAARYRQDPRGMLLVDTRQDWEYRSGHIKGAVNFPLEPTWWGRWRAQGPLRRLLGPDKSKFIVFY